MNTLTNQSLVKHWPVRMLSILLVIAIMVTLLPTAVSAASLAKTNCDATYQVKRGDTLTKISEKFGVAANQIVYANSWSEPYTIYVGQNICLPEKTVSGLSKLASKYADAVAAYFTAGRSGGKILIYTYNYPKTVVLVKVDNASDSAKNFYNLGAINIAQVGNGKTTTFKLPSALANASKLYICLKDRTTSYLQCAYPRSGS